MHDAGASRSTASDVTEGTSNCGNLSALRRHLLRFRENKLVYSSWLTNNTKLLSQTTSSISLVVRLLADHAFVLSMDGAFRTETTR